jgi:ligand-binding sensor domain-containing protein/class 3 adenylate cyclase
MRKLIAILFIASFCQSIAQNNYRFRNYTINDGLSQSAVTTVIQDNVGTLWIGTQDGLNRFDGQNFENFTSDKIEGLENDYIHSSIITKDGKLWFGTANGLTCYNPLLEVFKTFQLKGNIALQIESLVEENQGNIWFGSASSGLYLLNKKTQKIEHIKSNLPSNKIKFVAQKDLNHIFVSTEDQGLFTLNIKTKQATPIYIFGKKGSFVRVNTIRAMDNYSWMIGTNQGLYQLKNHSTNATAFLPVLDKSFGLLNVSDIEIETDNHFFVASQSQGLFSIDLNSEKPNISQATNDIFQKNSLLDNDLNVLFKDKKGTFWLGTNRGLGSFDPINAGFLSIGASGDLTKGIPSPSVWCFGEDQKTKFLFVGTDNAISRLNISTGKFDQFFKQKQFNSQGSVGETSILSIHVLSENDLLVGATDGLFSLKIVGNNFKYEKIKFDKIKNPSNFDRVYSIVHWKNNLYFLATKGGVLLYDRSTNHFTVFEHNPKKKKETIAPGVCRLIYKDLNGNIWFTTSVGGLNELKIKGDKLSIVPSKLNGIISGLSKDYITHINQCSKNIFWLGTMGSGIIRLDIKNQKGKIFSKKNGLPNNVIYGILNDKQGNLWLSTNKGISKFNIFNYESTNFTEVDGLLSNEFNQGAFLSSKSGLLYFGGISGFNYFDPNTLNNVTRKMEVSFTKIKLDANWLKPNDDTKILTTTISNTSHIDLSYKQRSFTLKIMAVDLSNPELVSYKYLLEGSDEGEILMGNFNQIHFNSLQPGAYVLKVYARLGNGEWSENPATLEIVIATPFWQTAWFWILMILIIGIAIFVLIRKKIDNERREQVRLEMKIAERTKEIRLQNVKIEKQKRTIEEKKDKLEEQKQLLEIEKEKPEKLLKNIIPESTYEELKLKGKAQARAFRSVSVMFTDFVGFTKIAEKIRPTELVNLLDIYFRKFDDIIVKNNLEKIKTIGDAYMCAGGVPVRNITNPIDACVAALQIQDYVKTLRLEAEKNNQVIWDLRLGINTGEVTAGVIGSEKLQYDIWGSTVNQAQRMEMLGEPGKVNISGNTFKHIEPYFVCVFRGKAMSKSKGYVEMYSVEGIKPELSIDGKGLVPNEKFKQIMNLHFYSSINYYKAEKHIMKILEKKLSPKLHYHCVEHTKDVCHAIERLALSEGITDEGLFLLKSAATYHDAGFVESYENNEPVGARMAEEILPNFGYSESHIEQIKELIYVTQIPHNPQNHLEEIICDADLDYLGRADFHHIADKLRRELREHGKIDSDKKWDEIQVGFLTNHRYFTETAKAARNEKKAQNLQEIKDRLARNEYVD